MDSGRVGRLRFNLSDHELNGVIDWLSDFGASWLHRNAWEVLMAEMERRQDGHPHREIELGSGVFDSLPSVIQVVLRDHVSTEPRRAVA